MQKKEFEFTMPLSTTREWAGQIKIIGEYGMDNCNLICNVLDVFHSAYQTVPTGEWRWVPNTFWTWLENGSDRIGEIAYEHCKGLMPQPNTPTDLLLNNKLD